MITHQDSHLSDLEFAAAVDGSLSILRRSHLQFCEECELTFASLTMPNPRDILAATAPTKAHRRFRPLYAGLAVAAAAVAFIFLLPADFQGVLEADIEVSNTLSNAARGGFVYPGFSDRADEMQPAQRSASQVSEDAPAHLSSLLAALPRTELPPENYYWISAFALELQQYDVTAQLLTEGLEKYPSSLPLQLVQGFHDFKTRSPAAGISVLQDLLARHPESGLLALNLGLMLKQSGHFDLAMEQFNNVASTNSDAKLQRRARLELSILN